jgi:cysteine desulfurase
MAMRAIYLDNNATTPLLPAVREAMEPFLTTSYGNPASSHGAGRRARQALENARELIATLLGADADEVIFTSGGTEANNLAIFGLCGSPPGQILLSPVEHPSVVEPSARLAELGFRVDRLTVDREGVICDPDSENIPISATRLAAVMLANNETGAVQPVSRLSARLGAGTAFHCDAVQAAGKIPIDFHALGVTSLSLSAHKFHGPMGIGALLLRHGSKLAPLFFGGHQQQGRRPGTEPVALAVGLAAALELAHRQGDSRRLHVIKLRNHFLSLLRERAAPLALNGPVEGGLPHTLNVSFPGCQADSLLMNLDLAGVACSTGSACSSGSLLPSPVLRVMGLPDELLRSAMRFSLSFTLSEDDVDEATRRIASCVERLRRHAEESQQRDLGVTLSVPRARA